MTNIKESIHEKTVQHKSTYLPEFFRLTQPEDREKLNQLIKNEPSILVHDEIESQIEELIKLRNPRIKHNEQSLEQETRQLVDGPLENYGVWVYYPWSLRLVHLLDEEEFIEVRTNRNKHKITLEESALLKKVKIGVVGLSVGKTISLAMAMERTFGEIRLADFDQLDLSNLNRLQTGVHSLGLSKTVIAAREILEIDPFLKVQCFPEGMTEENIERFFREGGDLDIIVDECDSLDIKILLRFKAKELGIPVVMDMNDRGTLDVERFDLEPGRSLLHGMIDHLDLSKIKGLSNIEKIPYILPMLGEKTISAKLKASMLEMGFSTSTWPQLASSVVLGGAIAADICRRISLDQFHASGRYWVDLEEQICDPPAADKNKRLFTPPELKVEVTADFPLSETELRDFIIHSPAIGNVRNWQVKGTGGQLQIAFRTLECEDGFNIELTELLSAGHLIDNFALAMGKEKLDYRLDDDRLIIELGQGRPKGNPSAHNYAYGLSKQANENATSLVEETLKSLGIEAEVHTTSSLPEEWMDLMLTAEKMKHLHPAWSSWYMNHYINWGNGQQGVEVSNFDFTDAVKALMDLGNDPEVVRLLNEWKGGDIFRSLYESRFRVAQGFFFIAETPTNKINILHLAEKLNRLLIRLNELDISIEPIPALPLISYNKLDTDDIGDHTKVTRMRHTFNTKDDKEPIFIGRII